MPSNEDNKQTEFKAKENSKKTEKAATKPAVAVAKKKKHSIGWFFGVIILILISITFVLPVSLIGFSGGSAITFGSYNGEKIKFEAAPENYFYNQYSSLLQRAQDTSSLQSVYQIWSNAFYNTVFFTAVDQMADDAKIIAADAVVDKTIRQTFINENGEFDVEGYKALDSASRAAIKQNVKQSAPAQIVIDDMSTVLTSKAESEAIAAQGNVAREFFYAVIDATSYPEDKALEYAAAHPEHFISADVSMLTVATEEEAKAHLATITSGEKTFEDVAKEVSLDNFKDAGGAAGVLYYFQLKEVMQNDEDVNKIFSANAGDIVGPIPMTSGYSLFQIISNETEPTLDKEDVLAVQVYLNSYEEETITAFAQAKADELYEMAKNSSFEAAVSRLGLHEIPVPATSQNVGGSTLLPTFAYSDSVGALAAVAADEAYYASLYNSEPGTILAPQKLNNAYIVTKVGEDKDESASTSFVTSYWPTIAGTVALNDLQNMIFGSDNFDDQFANVFFTKVYKLGSEE